MASGLLGLQILNDGKLPDSDMQKGTGSKLITELTSSWRFVECCGETLLDMSLPMLGHEALDPSYSIQPHSVGGGGLLSLNPGEHDEALA
jgi:hypothetical protein